MEACLQRWFLKDGLIVSSCDFDPKLMHADGMIYEVLRVMDGKLLFAEEHMDRLQHSLALARIETAGKITELTHQLKELIRINHVNDGNIKIVVMPGQYSSEIKTAAWFIPHYYPTEAMYRNGIRVSTLQLKRENPNIKIQRSSYRRKVDRAREMEDVFEILLVKDGMITEGSKTNVFFIRKEDCYTAPDSLVLKGITRDKVTRICKSRGIHLHFEAVRVQYLHWYEAAFLTGTSTKVLGISSIDGLANFQANHKVLNEIIDAYDDMIRNYLRMNNSSGG